MKTRRGGALAWLSSAAAALVLAACATPPKAAKPLPPYVAPPGSQTARLLGRGSVSGADVYGVLVFDDAATCSGPRLAGAGNASRPPKATELEAGRLATLEFLGVRADRTACRVRWSFVPSAGKTYLVAGALNASGCSARLMDASDPDSIQLEQSAQRRTLVAGKCSSLAPNTASTAALPAEHASGEAVLDPGATADDLQGLIKP
ncbi:MAG TPA: hypothetical protein VGK95_09595 [Caldimonas sp.]|jgi:hypothetical protein